MGAPPQLTLEERRAALAKAIKKMRVKELLESLPGFGEIRAMNILERAGISVSRRVQGVGRSQYETLLRLLKEVDR